MTTTNTSTQRIYGTHGTATVELAVDYGTAPPTITRYDIVGDVYESASELAAADEYHAAARWVGCGYDARNGGMTEAHRRDLRCAEDIAFAAASKQWRVFRRRLAEATAAWSESIRREEAEAYIVSALTVSAARAQGRTVADLFTPSDLVRDENGQPIGCLNLARHD